MMMVSVSGIDEYQPQPTRARTVEFAEIDALPLTEGKFAVAHRNHLRYTDQRSFDMGGAVAFFVLIGGRLLRCDSLQTGENVVLDGGIAVFVDGHSGGGMGRIDHADAVFHFLRYRGGDLRGDVDDLTARRAFDGDFSHGFADSPVKMSRQPPLWLLLLL